MLQHGIVSKILWIAMFHAWFLIFLHVAKKEKEKKVSEKGNILSDELLTQNMMHALLSEFYGIYVLDSNETDIIHDDYENV